MREFGLSALAARLRSKSSGAVQGLNEQEEPE
jgi:hypothetical protein